METLLEVMGILAILTVGGIGLITLGQILFMLADKLIKLVEDVLN